MSEQKPSEAADKTRSAARRSSGLEEDVAIVKTTPSATKRKEDMRNESTGISVGDSAHTLADVRWRLLLLLCCCCGPRRLMDG